MPSLQQQRCENHPQAEVQPGVRRQLLQQHAEREQQTEGIDRIEAGEASRPKASRRQRSTFGALGVVIGEDEAG